MSEHPPRTRVLEVFPYFKVNMPNLFAYLHMKGIYSEEIVADRNSPVVMTDFVYVDTNRKLWEWYEPEIILTVDVRNSVLRSANINITKPAFSPARIFPRELQVRECNVQ